MAPCNHEDANSCVLVHANDAFIWHGIKEITVHTIDTDVVVLAITLCVKLPDLNLKVVVGSSLHLNYYDVGIIPSVIGIAENLFGRKQQHIVSGKPVSKRAPIYSGACYLACHWIGNNTRI